MLLYDPGVQGIMIPAVKKQARLLWNLTWQSILMWHEKVNCGPNTACFIKQLPESD